MNIKVNSKQQELKDKTNISELLTINKVDKPEMVSVQLNGEFVDKKNFETVFISENDEVDFLYFMGGGQS